MGKETMKTRSRYRNTGVRHPSMELSRGLQDAWDKRLDTKRIPRKVMLGMLLGRSVNGTRRHRAFVAVRRSKIRRK